MFTLVGELPKHQYVWIDTAFTHREPNLSIADVARITGLPRAVARRCLYTLMQLGYVSSEDDRTFSLRAERDTGHGSTGRIYTVTYRVTDKAGNATVKSAIVTVPADNGGE